MKDEWLFVYLCYQVNKGDWGGGAFRTGCGTAFYILTTAKPQGLGNKPVGGVWCKTVNRARGRESVRESKRKRERERLPPVLPQPFPDTNTQTPNPLNTPATHTGCALTCHTQSLKAYCIDLPSLTLQVSLSHKWSEFCKIRTSGILIRSAPISCPLFIFYPHLLSLSLSIQNIYIFFLYISSYELVWVTHVNLELQYLYMNRVVLVEAL